MKRLGKIRDLKRRETTSLYLFSTMGEMYERCFCSQRAYTFPGGKKTRIYKNKNDKTTDSETSLGHEEGCCMTGEH